MSGVLSGKIALVTGAGKGIGQATALCLAREGAQVALTARTASDLDRAAAQIRADGGYALPMPGDITDEAFVDRLFQKVIETYGGLDILVNNAGIARVGPIEDSPADIVRRTLELNVTAAYNCLRHAVRIMKANGDKGKIINIGSVRSHWTECGGSGAYNASKMGIRAISESAARQLHGSGSRIAVSLICPGAVDTPLTNPKREPRPDWLRPEDVASAILYAAAAPDNVNVFDITLFAMFQKPW